MKTEPEDCNSELSKQNEKTGEDETCLNQQTLILYTTNKNSRRKNIAIISLGLVLVLCLTASSITIMTIWKEDCYNNGNNEANIVSGVECGELNTTVEQMLNKNQSLAFINESLITDTNSWPWLAFILENGKVIGNGALIHKQYVLISALSLYGKNENKLTVAFGISNISTIDLTRLYKVDRIIINEHFDWTPKGEFSNSIALIKLSKWVNGSKICLPNVKTTNKHLLDELAVVVGVPFDYLSFNYANIRLFEATVKIFDNHYCRRFAKSMYIYAQSFDDYCAHLTYNEIFKCFLGGSPLMIKTNNRWSVIGFISLFITCESKSPIYFTLVPSYLNWIHENIDYYD